jgi:hypothetical protein
LSSVDCRISDTAVPPEELIGSGFNAPPFAPRSQHRVTPNAFAQKVSAVDRITEKSPEFKFFVNVWMIHAF